MMKNSLILLVLTCLISACAVNTTTDMKVAPKTEAAPLTVKPGASIDFSYDVSKGLLPAEYGKVTLSFMDGYEAGTLRVEAEADEGLRLVSEVTEKEFSMAGDTPHEWELDVTAPLDGVYYLNILATVDLPDGRETGRAYSARIEVGDVSDMTAKKALKKNGVLSSDGSTVILEAQEEIK